MELEETANNNITTEDTTAGSTTAENNEVEKTESKTYTQEELDKLLQSERSKAKYSILQEMGVKNVDEFKTLKTQYETGINDSKEMKSKYDESEKTINELKENIEIMKLGVSDEYREDFTTLVHSKIAAGKSFTDAAKEVLERNPHYKQGVSNIRLGVDKSESKPKEISDEMAVRFPWLKN